MDFLKKQAVLTWKFYREEIGKTHLWCMVAFVLLCLGGWLVFSRFAQQAQEVLEGFMASVQESGLLDETGGISPLALFGNNLQATLTAAAMGFVPFVFLPVFSLVLNSVIIGAVLSLAGSLHMGGITAGQMLLLGLLPHGIFEIPAITLGIAMGLYLCRQMNGTLRKRPGTPRIEAVLPHLCRMAIFGLLPLLAAAAVIETYLTPVLLGLAL